MNEIRLQILDVIRAIEKAQRHDRFLSVDDVEALGQAVEKMQQAVNLVCTREARVTQGDRADIA